MWPLFKINGDNLKTIPEQRKREKEKKRRKGKKKRNLRKNHTFSGLAAYGGRETNYLTKLRFTNIVLQEI